MLVSLLDHCVSDNYGMPTAACGDCCVGSGKDVTSDV